MDQKTPLTVRESVSSLGRVKRFDLDGKYTGFYILSMLLSDEQSLDIFGNRNHLCAHRVHKHPTESKDEFHPQWDDHIVDCVHYDDALKVVENLAN